MTEPELEAMIHATYSRLFWRIYSRLRNEADAEEVAMDVYWRAWRRLDLQDGRDPWPWLAASARKRVDTRLRIREHHQDVSLDQLSASGWEASGGSAPPDVALDRVSALAAGLPPIRRLVFMLREWAGWPDERIASQLGITETTVRRHASLAESRLRSVLAPPGAPSPPQKMEQVFHHPPSILTIHAHPRTP